MPLIPICVKEMYSISECIDLEPIIQRCVKYIEVKPPTGPEPLHLQQSSGDDSSDLRLNVGEDARTRIALLIIVTKYGETDLDRTPT